MTHLPDELREAIKAAKETGQDVTHWMTDAAAADMRKIIKLAAERQMESLNLYEPTPFQEEFHSCLAKECILSKGNQTGGTLSGAVELARAVMGLGGKYRKRGGIAAIVGYGAGHIGRVFYRYLRQWGAFEIIPDEETGLWRTYRPWPKDKEVEGKPGDLHRAAEARPAPPLIPDRMMDGDPAWVKKSEYQFSVIRLKTGWEIHAFNSQGDFEHAQGFQCDLFWIDEDTATGGWVTESMGRLSKRKGYFRWTAMPHAKTEDLPLLLQRCEDEELRAKETGKPARSVVIYAGIDDNPYLPDETKEENKRIWATMGDEEYARRVEGRLSTGGLRMYPKFNIRIHRATVELDDIEREQEAAGMELRHKVQKILTENQGVPPQDWTRYISIDPGHRITACMFEATPPPSLGEFLVIYDELYIPQCIATTFVREFKKKAKGQLFQEFILDYHGARLTSLVDGRQILGEYEKLFKEEGIACRSRGHRCTPAVDNLELREMQTREALSIRAKGRERGHPKLLVVEDKCPNFIKEMMRFHKTVQKVAGREIIMDKANRKGDCHAVESVEGLIAHGCEYHAPPRQEKAVGTVRVKRRLLKRRVSSLMMTGNGGVSMGAQGLKE